MSTPRRASDPRIDRRLPPQAQKIVEGILAIPEHPPNHQALTAVRAAEQTIRIRLRNGWSVHALAKRLAKETGLSSYTLRRHLSMLASGECPFCHRRR